MSQEKNGSQALFQSTIEEKGYFKSFIDKLWIMFRRNTILQVRLNEPQNQHLLYKSFDI